ncbi:MAG: acyl-CoA synthetase [Myxococcota bacterium]
MSQSTGQQTPLWNYGDLMDRIDAVMPADAPALVHGDRSITWGDFARRTNNLARRLGELGAQPGDKVAFYMRNVPAYTETLVACFKGRFVHVNVNFRYTDDELHYIFDNSDAAVVVYGAEFRDHIQSLAGRLDKVKAFVQVDGEGRPEGVFDYEEIVGEGAGEPLGIERSPDDLLFIYTGGTTGMPKGVMWRAEDLWGALGYGVNAPCNEGEVPPDPETHVANVQRFGPGLKQVPSCPLMHGTGLLTAITTISSGGCIVTMEKPSFDAEELFDTIERHRVTSTVIVGDAFARPMLDALEANPGRWNLESLKMVVSSGVMWSREVKQGLLRHHPGMMLVDTFGSSEAVGFGTSVTTAAGETRTARFQIGEKCKVFTEDHREVQPGSEERGFIARCGPIPMGYYKDPEKSAKTFPTIEGVRYSIPGDWCTVEADGTLTLLGRGSVCINTAGEKVYPEEVEEALKTHPDVEDALVVGLPDEKWGQSVTGVVQLREGADLDEGGLRQHVRSSLAGYKSPKRVVAVEQMFRAPNGKADYKSATAFARQSLLGD